MKSTSLMSLLFVAVLLGCVSSGGGMVTPALAPVPVNGSINGQDARMEGTTLYVRANFFKGNAGDYRMVGNFGDEGVSWGRGYSDGLRVENGYIAVDLRPYIDRGRFLAGQTYCVTFRAEPASQRNWLNNHALLPEQVYPSPRGEPNIAVYVDWQGVPYVSNEYADPVRFPC